MISTLIIHILGMWYTHLYRFSYIYTLNMDICWSRKHAKYFIVLSVTENIFQYLWNCGKDKNYSVINRGRSIVHLGELTESHCTVNLGKLKWYITTLLNICSGMELTSALSASMSWSKGNLHDLAHTFIYIFLNNTLCYRLKV